MEESAEGTSPAESTFSQFYNASQVRADSWNRLKALTARLCKAQQQGRDTDVSMEQIRETLKSLGHFEGYWAFPGRTAFAQLTHLLDSGQSDLLSRTTARITRALMSNAYRKRTIQLALPSEPDEEEDEDDARHRYEDQANGRPYFEVLIVDNISPQHERSVRAGLRTMRRSEDRFIYEPVVVPSFEDALIAVLFNHNIQAVVVRYDFPYRSAHRLSVLQRYLTGITQEELDDLSPHDYAPILCQVINRVRPELDLYLVTDRAVEEIAGKVSNFCRRVFYNQEDYLELHLNILRGIMQRYKTPFFTALRDYSKQPTGVFHAMPISRGKSITKSHWIGDMGEFYGMNIFLAETSSTSGGLDSLLDPHGPIKEAQEKAARAFGARQTFFATNGTSTCNKIVVQALVRPGDIVLVDRDCHKSHHYGMVLSGADVVYLDSYPLPAYSMYGAVPLREIKQKLLDLRRAGKLHRVRMLLLTNCTFDGIVYNVERVMEECLAIKPDLVFLWDEAWFGFARFGPTYRQRTAMNAAAVLRDRYRSAAHREAYEAQQREMAEAGAEFDTTWLERRLLPDPDAVRIRAYATQSTHKTLTSLRQGSMIHVYDQDYKAKVEDSFHEAYMTHTSTSPNYQILASLDVGRRQVELEGFELVQKQVEMAMVLRARIVSHPLLSKYFQVLRVGDLVPPEYRQSGIASYYDPGQGWSDIWDAWANDEFTLDATRVTLYVGATGLDGDSFKTKILMDKHGIQINKTSRNTVLFMTNIGTTRSSVAYLIEVLCQIAQELDDELDEASPVERRLHEKRVRALCEDVPPLPDFSRFHAAFRDSVDGETPEGNIRAAYFMAYDEAVCDYLSLDDPKVDQAIADGKELVAATFIIPYPPGFPILVPGQVISGEILTFMRALDVKEIHGYRPELGIRIFRDEALAGSLDETTSESGRSAAE